jgi:hypothetical protein
MFTLGQHNTAALRRSVADISIKHATFDQAVASLAEPKDLTQELTRSVIVNLLSDEYDDAGSRKYKQQHAYV